MTIDECPIEKGPPNTGYLYLDYLKQLETVKQLDLNSLIYRMNRTFLIIGGYVACIHPFPHENTSQSNKISQDQAEATDGQQNLNNGRKYGIYFSEANLASISKKMKSRRGSILVRCLYYLFTLHVCVNLHYQYKYDFAKMLLIRSESSDRRQDQYGCMLTGNESKYELELTSRMLQAKQMLYIVGAPYSHMSMTIEFLYICIILFAFIIFYFSYIVHHYVTPINLHTIREHLDFAGERKLFEQFIMDAVEKFKESNRLFARMQSQCHCNKSAFHLKMVELLNSNAEQLPTERQKLNLETESYQLARFGDSNQDKMSASLTQRSVGAKLFASELKVEQMLTKMLSIGALTPFTKSENWFDLRSKLALIFQILTAIYLLTFFLLIIRISTPQTDPNRRLGPMDYLIQVSASGLITIIFFATCLHSTYSFIACLDQIVLINKLQELIKHCIRVNHDEFFATYHTMAGNESGSISSNDARTSLTLGDTDSMHSLTRIPAGKIIKSVTTKCWQAPMPASSMSSRNSIDYGYVIKADKMNTNLLFVLMHYKIFLAQARPVIESLNPVIIMASSILLLIPITIKVHMPYLNLFQVKDIRLFAAGVSSTVVMPAVLVILPLCYLHNRCQKLYVNMSSLIAHLIEVENHTYGKNLYDHHTVLMLSKELRHPERFVEQFKARFVGLSGTYTTLVKILFWWGLIVISIMVDSQSGGRSLFESILEDPLRAF